jgi:hypothetical protein
VTPCLTGSALERMLEAIAFSEENRARVAEITESYRESTTRQVLEQFRQRGQPPPTRRELDYYVQQRAASDPRFAVAVNNERWGWRLATLYEAQVSAQNATVTHSLLREILTELRRQRGPSVS